mgnify:CR=1 FL=1
MDNIKDAAVHFEAVKTSMSQSKAGTILRLAIHPNEVPANLHTDWVGSRYMVAMVKLNEQDEPEISVEQREVDKLIASAGMLCRNPSFVEFLHENFLNSHQQHHVMQRACYNNVKSVLNAPRYAKRYA